MNCSCRSGTRTSVRGADTCPARGGLNQASPARRRSIQCQPSAADAASAHTQGGTIGTTSRNVATSVGGGLGSDPALLVLDETPAAYARDPLQTILIGPRVTPGRTAALAGEIEARRR